MAFIATNNIAEAEKEIISLESFRGNETIDSLLIWGFNSAGILIDIAIETARGELAGKKKNYSEAIAHLKKLLGTNILYNMTNHQPGFILADKIWERS